MDEKTIKSMINKYKCCIELKQIYFNNDFENIDTLIKIICISNDKKISLHEASLDLLKYRESQPDYIEDHFLILCSTKYNYAYNIIKRKLLLNYL